MWEQNSGGPEDGAMFQTPSDVQSLGIDEDGTGVTAGRRTGSASKRVVKKPKRDEDEGFLDFDVTGSGNVQSNGHGERRRSRSLVPAPGQEEDEDGAAPRTYRSLMDDEAKFREGTKKHICFSLLKEAGPQGLSIANLMEKARESGASGDWANNETSRRVLQYALANDSAFTRVAKGVYTLSALASPNGRYVVTERKPAAAKGPRASKKEKDVAFQPVQSGEVLWLDYVLGMNNGFDYDHSITVRSEVAPAEGSDMDAWYLFNGFQAEEAVDRVQQELKSHVDRQELAAAKVQQYKMRVKEWDMQNRAPPPRKKDEEFPNMPSFEVPAHLREYTGDPDDSKAIRAHRKELQAVTQQMEREKREWIEEQRAARKRAQSNINKGGAGIRKQLKEAERAHELASRLVMIAQQALTLAEKNLSKESGKKGVAARKAKEREEKEAYKLALREERDRLQAEEASIRYYPIDDLELLEENRERARLEGLEPPIEDVPRLQALEEAVSTKLFSSLYIADFVSQFSRVLGMPPLSYRDLEGMLALPECAREDALRKKTSLFTLYQGLLRFIFWKSTVRLEKRWQSSIARGTWPEVLRRYILTRPSKGLVDPVVRRCAALMGCEGLAALGEEEHRTLLQYLCDEILDRDGLRDHLQNRMDAADGNKKDRHGNRWEEIGNFPAFEEVGKESWREYPSEARSEEVVWATQPNGGSELGCGLPTQNGYLSGAPSSEIVFPQSSVKRGTEGDAALATGSSGGNGVSAMYGQRDGAPSAELQDNVGDYRGDPDANSGFGAPHSPQEQVQMDLREVKADAEPQKMDWEARAEQSPDVGEARSKRQAEEDAIILQHEQHERQAGRLAVRHNPIGLDRYHRRYWWGLAGERGVLFVEEGNDGEDASWSVAQLTSPPQLDALLTALDRDGIREAALAQNLEDANEVIQICMNRAQAAERKRALTFVHASENGDVRPLKRERLNGPGTCGVSCSVSRGNSPPPTAQRLPEEDALDRVLQAFNAIQTAALATAVDGPPGGWKAFELSVQEAGRNAFPSPGCPAGPVQKEALEILKTKLLEVEERVHSVARPTGEEDEDADVNDQPTFKKLRGRAASKAKALAAAAAKAAAAARRENLARRGQMGLGPVGEGNGHDGATGNLPPGEDGAQQADANTNGDEDGAASLPGDDNAYQDDGEDDADNDARDEEGEEDDGDEENGDDQKSQYGEEGMGDLTRQSSAALEDVDGLPSAAFRALEHVEDGPDKRRSGRLWRSAKERWMWRKDATLILNLTWLAYSTTVLEANALPVLKYVKRNIDRAAANRAAAASKVKPTAEELAQEQAARLAQAYTGREKRANAKKWEEEQKKRGGYKRRDPSEDRDLYRKPRLTDASKNRENVARRRR